MKTDLVYKDYEKYEVKLEEDKAFVESMKILGKGECHRHRFRFENGYGASVIKNYGSYGFEQDLFEIAVIKYNGPEDKYGELCYSTPVTDDVIGYLTNDDVLKILEQIKSL